MFSSELHQYKSQTWYVTYTALLSNLAWALLDRLSGVGWGWGTNQPNTESLPRLSLTPVEWKQTSINYKLMRATKEEFILPIKMIPKSVNITLTL